MKQVFFAFSVITFIIIGCNRDTSGPPEFILEANKLSISLQDSVSSTDTIKITSNTAWTVEVPPGATWLQVEPLNGHGDGFIVFTTTEKNSDSLSRGTNIEVKTTVGNKSVIISVTQLKLQESFFKAVFGGSGDEDFNNVIKSSDGNFIAVGTSPSSDGDVESTTRSVDVWIIKFDKNGNRIWNKTYGGSGFELGISIVKTTSNNYLVLGQTESIDGDVSTALGDSDAWLFSIDDEGNLLWEKSIGGGNFDALYSMEPTSDGHYLLAGETMSSNHDVSFNYGYYDSWLVKINDQGNIIWQKTFGGSKRDRIFDAQQVSTGGYIFYGTTESIDGDVSDRQDTGFRTWFGKIDKEGNILWSKYLETGSSFSFGALETSNGDYVFGGSAIATAGVDNYHGNTDGFVCRLDTMGNYIWKKAFGGTEEEQVYHIIATTDDHIVMAGYSKSADGDIQENAGGEDAMLIVIDADGRVVQNKTYGGAEDDDVFRIIEISTNQFAFVGTTSSYEHKYPGIANNTNGWFGIVSL